MRVEKKRKKTEKIRSVVRVNRGSRPEGKYKTRLRFVGRGTFVGDVPPPRPNGENAFTRVDRE